MSDYGLGPFSLIMALFQIKGVMAAVLGFWMGWWAFGLEPKKYFGLMGCVLLMIIGSIVGAL